MDFYLEALDRQKKLQELIGECLEFAEQMAEKENCYKMMLLIGSKKPETLWFYEKAGYNSSDKTAFIQWIQKYSGFFKMA